MNTYCLISQLCVLKNGWSLMQDATRLAKEMQAMRLAEGALGWGTAPPLWVDPHHGEW